MSNVELAWFPWLGFHVFFRDLLLHSSFSFIHGEKKAKKHTELRQSRFCRWDRNRDIMILCKGQTSSDKKMPMKMVTSLSEVGAAQRQLWIGEFPGTTWKMSTASSNMTAPSVTSENAFDGVRTTLYTVVSIKITLSKKQVEWND